MNNMTPEHLMIQVNEQMPEFGVPVIGYNHQWIDEDFNHRGLRECFIYGDGTQWHTAKWNDGPDCYETTDDDKPTHWSPMLNSAALSTNGGEVKSEFEETDCIELLGMMARITPEIPPHTVSLTKEQAMGIYNEAGRLRDRAIHFSNWPAFYYTSQYFRRLCEPAPQPVAVPEGQHLMPSEFLREYLELLEASNFKAIHKIVRRNAVECLLAAAKESSNE